METKRVAVIEDVQDEVNRLKRYFENFSAECSVDFQITPFNSAESFLAHYRPVYDLVLMDIMLPGMNGMDAAGELRQLDQTVTLIFITNMANFAVHGYEVDAFDFIVKPVSYSQFTLKMKRTLKHLSQISMEKDIVLTLPNQIVRLRSSQIYYIESQGHRILYHTSTGVYDIYGSMKDTEASLDPQLFARCNNGYLVNMNYVTAIDGTTVTVHDEQLVISRPRRKAFIEQLTKFLGGNL